MKEINNGQLRIKDIGKEVTLKGWVANKRKLGSLIFIDLRDRWGITQIVSKEKLSQELTKESVIEVTGKVFKRKDINPNMITGEIEVILSTIKILSISNNLPFVIKDAIDAKEENRLKYRFLDLRRNKMVNNLTVRYEFIKNIRNFLDQKNFLEIETPYLSKSTPEGARDYLVATRKKGKFFALPQSPQLYKQLLMASGMERYFQFAHCFRDEDLRSDRQLEFTQLDIELSFINEEQIIKMIEEMMQFTFMKLGHKIDIPFKRIRYEEALDFYGSDKPDLRFGLELKDVKYQFANTGFNLFKNAKTIKMIAFDKVLVKKQIKILEEVAKKNKAKGLFYTTLENDVYEGSGAKFILEESRELFAGMKSGTLLFVADDYYNVVQSLGAVRLELNKMFNLAKKDKFNFCWILDWPLFEYNKEKGKYVSLHHPFTAPTDDWKATFTNDQKNAKSKAYDLILNGYEIGGGSIRNHEYDIQEKMFQTLGMSKEMYNEKFGFFLEAYKYGMPPHGGIAFGIDRIITILQGEDSIREVIAFPKNAKGTDPMSNSPSDVTEKQLDEYFIKVK